MKVCIVYFSQTDNTKKVAEAIQKGLQDKDVVCDMYRLEECTPEALASCDLIGIGTPVFYFKEPFNVRDFLKALPRVKGKYAFTFVTHGGHAANTQARLDKLLSKKGLTVIDTFKSLGYDTYPIFIGKDRQKGHPDAEELKQARAFGNGLSEKYRKIAQEGDTSILPVYEKVTGRFNRLSFILSKFVVGIISPKKNLNEEKCTQCGVCVEKCPTDAITLEPYPVFSKDKCIYCYMCYKECPVDAIECDWSFIEKRMSDE